MKFTIIIIATLTLLCVSCLENNRFDLTKIPEPKAVLSEKPENFSASEITYQAYVPVYSDLLLSHENHHIALQGFVSIRNTDFQNPLLIEKITYYNTNGKFIREHIDKPIYIKPFSSYNVIIKTNDLDGGSGAKFLINYKLANSRPNHPLTEALFVGKFGTKAVSFSSRGVLLNN